MPLTTIPYLKICFSINRAEGESLKFADTGLHPTLLKALDDLGFTEPTEIQIKSLPILLKGGDISGLAQTGTGKTAAFLLPLMHRVIIGQERARDSSNPAPEESPEEERDPYDPTPRGPEYFVNWRDSQFVLILVPTRELAEQAHQNFLNFSKHTSLKGVSVYGGVGYDKQKEGLRSQVEFIFATPGRLIDLYKDRSLDFKGARAVVFDEADRMFDMGFAEDMKFILSRVPEDRQVALFSATLNLEVMNILYRYGSNPIDVNVSKDRLTADQVQDQILHVGHDEKLRYLISLLKKHPVNQTIVFTNFKNNVGFLSDLLQANGFTALGISSVMSQSQRTQVMDRFREAKTPMVLVATDVAARGLDVTGLDLVINYELPMDAENYVHRIGRTGRAQEKGRAFSLVSDQDVESLQRIENYVSRKIDVEWLDDSEIVAQKDVALPPRATRPRQDRGSEQRGGQRSGRAGGSGRGGRGPRGADRGSERASERNSDSRGPASKRSGATEAKPADKPPRKSDERRDRRKGKERSKPHQTSESRGPHSKNGAAATAKPTQSRVKSSRRVEKPQPSLMKKITGMFSSLFGR